MRRYLCVLLSALMYALSPTPLHHIHHASPPLHLTGLRRADRGPSESSAGA